MKTKWTSKGILYGILSFGLLIFLVGVGFDHIIAFFEDHDVQHAIVFMMVTACVIFFFRFKKETFGPWPKKVKKIKAQEDAKENPDAAGHHKKHDHSHDFQEVLLGSFHGNYVILVLTIDKYLKMVEPGSAEARKLHHYYMIGLAMTSLLIIGFVVPLITIISSMINDLAALSFLYYVSYLTRVAVVGYWALTLIFGWREVSEGNRGIVYLAGRSIFTKKHGEGVVLTFIGLGFVRIKEWPAEIAVNCLLTGRPGDRPMIVTPSYAAAIWKKKQDEDQTATTDSAQKTRLSKEPLSLNRMRVKYTLWRFVFALKDQAVDEKDKPIPGISGAIQFAQEVGSLEALQENILAFMEGIQLHKLGTSAYGQILDSIPDVEADGKALMDIELKNNKCGYYTKNAKIRSIDYLKAVEKPSEIITAAA